MTVRIPSTYSTVSEEYTESFFIESLYRTEPSTGVTTGPYTKQHLHHYFGKRLIEIKKKILLLYSVHICCSRCYHTVREKMKVKFKKEIA